MLGNRFEPAIHDRIQWMAPHEQYAELNPLDEEWFLEDFTNVPAPLAGTPLNASIAQEPGVERPPAGAPEPTLLPLARGLAGTPTTL